MSENENKDYTGLDAEVDETQVMPKDADENTVFSHEAEQIEDSAEDAAEGTLPKLKSLFAANRTVATAVCCVGAAALIGLGGWYATTGLRATNTNADNEPATVEQVSYKEAEETQTSTVLAIDYSAPGIKEDSTPVIVHIMGTAEVPVEKTDNASTEAASTESAATTEAAEATSEPTTTVVDFYHAFQASEIVNKTAEVELDKGEYKVEVLPSLNTDGSLNSGTTEAVEPAEKSEQVGIEETKKDEAKVEGTTTDAKDVTQDQVNEVLDKVNEAVAKGDESLKGDTGTSVVDNYKQAAEANPNINKEETEKKVEEAKKETSTTPTTSTPSSSTSSSSSSSSSSGSSSSSSSSSNSPQQSEPTHNHNWVAQYKTVTDYKDVKVVDEEAWYKDVCVGYNHIFPYDGFASSNMDEVYAHQKELALAGVIKTGFYDEPIYQTVLVPEVAHYESQAVGSHEEITGYVCSGCGATK